jgi:hypothetical protein
LRIKEINPKVYDQLISWQRCHDNQSGKVVFSINSGIAGSLDVKEWWLIMTQN